MQTHRNQIRDYLYLTKAIERELWRTVTQKATRTRVNTLMPHLVVFQRRCLERLALLEGSSASNAEVLAATLVNQGERLVNLLLRAYAQDGAIRSPSGFET